ncbi:MAG: UDP-glucose 4-epimerase GalE [Dehalococcoidales bacterium]
MNILITGAAGYVGSVVAEEAVKNGHSIIALDDLSLGHQQAVPGGALLIKGNFGDKDLLDILFRKYMFDAVMHIAASTIVSQSVADPARYFQNNIANSLNLLDKMVEYRVTKLIFSSSCAVYGYPDKVPIKEDILKNPVNPYGEAKLMLERILHWYAGAYKFDSVSLRYFNAAGANGRRGEDHSPETHLIPLLLQVALGNSKNVAVFGNDYPTPDGTCIRDYVHVVDIASAHLLALDYLSSNPGCYTFNLGNGQGYSVLQIYNSIKSISGRNISVTYKGRRPGDPPVLIADSTLAKERLGWRPSYTGIKEIIESAWQWHKKHPNGYNDTL